MRVLTKSGLRLSMGADLPKNQMIVKRVAFFLCVAILVTRCTEVENMRLNGPDFYPLAVGKYWIYEVMETTYSPLQPAASDTFQLMVQVVDSFVNTEGGITYVLHRLVRQEQSLPWQFTETWSARLTDQFVVVNEGNMPFIPLAFPLHPNRKWNANLLNDLPADEYKISEILSNYSNGLAVDVAVNVEQENVANNLTYRDVRMETYGKGVGLVSSISEVWTYTCTGGTCTGVISSGYKRVQNLVDYGTM